MTVREAIQQVKGFRYMTEQLNICSSLGRRCLYEMCWLNTEEEVCAELKCVAEVMEVMSTTTGKSLVEKLSCLLMQVRDIRGTVKHAGEYTVLDDLELFELKNFVLLAEEMNMLTVGWKCVKIPDVGRVLELLDPEGVKIPHFYIYDCYSAELAALRVELKLKKQQGGNEQEVEQLFLRCVALEDEVRENLSEQLREEADVLREALVQVGRLDILVAKATQAIDLHLSRPQFRQDKTILKGLFNPQLDAALQEKGKRFQPVDVTLLPCTTLITGANMAGKTVLLKSVALAQCLFQFGFYVPAVKAEMVLMDGIQMSIGDEQDELSGLSSFAAEMLRINEIVKRVKAGERVLVLIDELARTTNPLEGRAIVNGVVSFLTEYHAMSLVTTHYSGIVAPCRKLRVRGFVEEKIQGQVTWKNINDFIDYSLEEDQGGEVPHEALRIAAFLGVDKILIERAEKSLCETVN